MSRNPFKFFLSLLFFCAVACCSAKPAVASSVAEPVKQEALASQLQEFPHTDIEIVHQPVTAAWQTVVIKNAVTANLPVTIIFSCYAGNASLNSHIKASSLLIKDYLLFIYPSHNFW